MKRLGSLMAGGLALLVLGGCAAGVPATIEPTSTAVVIAAAPTQETTAVPAQAAPTAVPPTVAPIPTEPPVVASAPAAANDAATDDTSAAIAAPDAAAAAESNPSPASAEVGTESGVLAYQASDGRLAPPAPPADGSLLTIPRGPSGRLEVALTFDAGADTGYAGNILDTLRDYGIKATFGMTGVWAEQNPDLVRRMVSEGHQIINHTYDHQSLTGGSTGAEPMTYDTLLWELDSTEQIVRNIAGYEMKPYFRPPYGDFGPITSGYLVDAGYYINVMWTCDSFGWKGWDAAEIVSHCTSDIGPGEIILLHVGAAAPGDFESLPGLIDTFASAGYSFVTIEQMLQP